MTLTHFSHLTYNYSPIINPWLINRSMILYIFVCKCGFTDELDHAKWYELKSFCAFHCFGFSNENCRTIPTTTTNNEVKIHCREQMHMALGLETRFLKTINGFRINDTPLMDTVIMFQVEQYSDSVINRVSGFQRYQLIREFSIKYWKRNR